MVSSRVCSHYLYALPYAASKKLCSSASYNRIERKVWVMNKYIATFHSHFGAMLYFKALKDQEIAAKLMPVPRKVSASCGTCVRYEHTLAMDHSNCELDSVYIETVNGFDCVLTK